MTSTSAGVLVYRRGRGALEFLLGHPGGPFWARKDMGAWMIPKGVIAAGETAIDAAQREFREETGLACPPLTPALAPLRQAGGKDVLCWAAEADLDRSAFRPSTFDMVWPPRSGDRATFAELDRLTYFERDEAFRRILPSQSPLLAEVISLVGDRL